MAIMEITIVPLGTKDTSLSAYVAECIKIIQGLGLKYEVTAMGTQVEGDPELLFEIARKLHEIPFQKGAMRVLTLVKIDDRRDKPHTLEGKITSVKQKLKDLA